MPNVDQPRVYRVGQLNRKIAEKLQRWGEVWVEGEISDATHAGSGHVYFTLNDSVEAAQIRCVMFQSDAKKTPAKLRNDERVQVRGAFDFYPPRGTFQLVVRVALPTGDGDRREQIERLKRKLDKEGLFATARKRKIPRFPTIVGIVTSRRGAALHDVVRVASARAPVRLVLSHCLVQGTDAPESIVMALEQIARLPGLDVVILTRGGGASEDLMAFNDERVARAIAACPVPVVAGVGHEVDATIADLVADVRAATPSHAAELVVPERAGLEAELDAQRRRLERAFEIRLGHERVALDRLARRLRDPRHGVAGVRRRFWEAASRLERGMRRRLSRDRERREELARRLHKHDPTAKLGRERSQIDALAHRLEQALPPALAARRRALELTTRRIIEGWGPIERGARARLGELASRLDALSPLAVLGRGYAIALHGGRALTDASGAKVGDALRVRLARGTLEAEVRAILVEPE